MKEQIKELRISIDGYTKLINQLNPIIKIYKKAIVGSDEFEDDVISYNSKEIDTTVDKLYLVKYWLGKLFLEFAHINDENIVLDRDVALFRPNVASDWIGFPTAWWEEATRAEMLEWLISEITEIFNKLMDPDFHTIEFEPNEMGDLYWNNVYTYLSESIFYLEKELERVKNEN